MDTERSAVINIGGVDYELVLTTRATKEIAGRYGGLENLGDKLIYAGAQERQYKHSFRGRTYVV